jgi:hypothetical protein
MEKNHLMSVALVIVIVCAFVLVGFTNFSTVQASTITGVIDEDATWSKSNSPYVLTGPVRINSGVTLTIEAGVTVNLQSYYLLVEGTLMARGTSIDKVTFSGGAEGTDSNQYAIYPITFAPTSTDWNETTGTGCIIDNAILSSTWLYISTCPKISNSIFNGGSHMWISSSYSGSGANHYNASPIISNNTFQGIQDIISTYAIGTFYASALIANNTISGYNQGLVMSSDTATVVQGNLITGNTYGIETIVHQGDVSPIIQNNTITNNTVGISLTAQFSAPTSAVLVYNNIYFNTNYNLQSAVSSNINATFNWWGTADTTAISTAIYDYNEDFNLGTVAFDPILSSPSTTAPTYVVASAGAGGSISSSGITRLIYGDSQSFTITPNSGYHIVDVLVNGTSVGAVGSYTVQNIQGVTTVSATFAPDSTPTPAATTIPSSTPVVPEFPFVLIIAFMLTALTGTTLFYARNNHKKPN